MCDGILPPHEEYKRYKRENRCLACCELRKRLSTSSKKKKCDINKRNITIKRQLHSKKKKRLHRLQKKVEKY